MLYLALATCCLMVFMVGRASAAPIVAETAIDYGKDQHAAVFHIQVELANLTDDSFIVAHALDENTFSLALTYRPAPASASAIIDIYGRFRQLVAAEVALMEVSRRDQSKRLLNKIRLSPPDRLPENRALVTAWAETWAGKLIQDDPDLDSGFTYFELADLARRYQLDLVPALRPRDRRAELAADVDLYSVTTGALAIQESLQDKVTLRVDNVRGDRVKIAQLAGPQIKSHPFEEMLRGRESVSFEIARLVPYDQYYVHFSSITAEIALTDLLDQWGTSLLQSLEVTARDRRVKERILAQLNLQLSSLTRLFGDYVIGDFAITGNDPFLTDGNDVTVIFTVKNALVFDQAIAQQRAERQRKRTDAALNTIKYEGIEITAFTTKDRELSSYCVALDGYRIFANSLPALYRVIDTMQGKRLSLRQADDFRYMRSIFPGTNNDEDGFIYLSDAFIRRVVGAEQKIARLRQLQCVSQLRAIENSALLAAIERPEHAPTLTELSAAGRLNEASIHCSSAGDYYLNSDGQAVCTVHGTLHYLTPLVEIQTDSATAAEAAGYRQFVEQYNQYWSQFFDPVGIRFRVKDRIEVETCILPLIENSAYNSLREGFGGAPIALTTLPLKETIGSLTFKLNRKSDAVKGMLHNFFFIGDGLNSAERTRVIELLGDGLTINFCDSSPLFTVNSEAAGQLLLGSRGFMRGDSFFFGIMLSAITLPIYLTLDLNDSAAVENILDRTLLSMGWRRAQGPLRQEVESYTFEPYRGHNMRALVINFFVVKFRLFIAIVDNRLIIATQRRILTHLIDESIEHRLLPTQVESGNLMLQLRPQAFDQMKQIASIHWQERMRETCFTNLPACRLLLARLNISEKALAGESLRRFGYLPFCPAGGEYKFDRETGLVSCSVHGTQADPRQPLEASGAEPFINFLASLQRLDVVLQFTPEGLRTKLVIARDK